MAWVFWISGKHCMPEDKDRFEKQDDPLKNTDHAFVRVGKDGEPELPASAAEEKKQDDEDRREEGLKHR
jgi:hypothetical protein